MIDEFVRLMLVEETENNLSAFILYGVKVKLVFRTMSFSSFFFASIAFIVSGARDTSIRGFHSLTRKLASWWKFHESKRNDGDAIKIKRFRFIAQLRRSRVYCAEIRTNSSPINDNHPRTRRPTLGCDVYTRKRKTKNLRSYDLLHLYTGRRNDWWRRCVYTYLPCTGARKKAGNSFWHFRSDILKVNIGYSFRPVTGIHTTMRLLLNLLVRLLRTVKGAVPLMLEIRNYIRAHVVVGAAYFSPLFFIVQRVKR